MLNFIQASIIQILLLHFRGKRGPTRREVVCLVFPGHHVVIVLLHRTLTEVVGIDHFIPFSHWRNSLSLEICHTTT